MSDQLTAADRLADVLIVGGGPAGYSTAIALARHDCTNVIVLERSPSVDYFEPTKSFVYCLFPHGKDVLRSLGLSDIDHAGCVKDGMESTRIYPNGRVEHKVLRRTAQGGKGTPVSELNTWMPRHSLNQTLYNHIQAHHADAVQVVCNVQVTNVAFPSTPGERITISTCTGAAEHSSRFGGQESIQDGGSTAHQYVCRLLVGADGVGSAVRTALHASQPDAGWDYTSYPSPSGVLRWKVLTMPPCPTINASTGSIPNSMTTVLKGAKTPGFRDGRRPLSAAMLNDVVETHTRGAVMVLKADDPFWKVSTPDELYSVLQRAFPQVDDWRSLVPLPVAHLFVDTPDSGFKHPSTTGRLSALFPDEAAGARANGVDSLQGCGAFLLGDAAHVFPPDLGQGVNSTLLDVGTLARCLAEHPSDMAAALLSYEARRLPENLALTQTMQVGAAYQYEPLANTLQSRLHSGSNTVRYVLARWLPQLASPPVALMLLRPSKEARAQGCATLYQDAWRKHKATTTNLCIVLAALLLTLALTLRGRLSGTSAASEM